MPHIHCRPICLQKIGDVLPWYCGFVSKKIPKNLTGKHNYPTIPETAILGTIFADYVNVVKSFWITKNVAGVSSVSNSASSRFTRNQITSDNQLSSWYQIASDILIIQYCMSENTGSLMTPWIWIFMPPKCWHLVIHLHISLYSKLFHIKIYNHI